MEYLLDISRVSLHVHVDGRIDRHIGLYSMCGYFGVFVWFPNFDGGLYGLTSVQVFRASCSASA